MSVLADIVRMERKVWKEFLIDFQLSKLLDFSWVNLSLFSCTIVPAKVLVLVAVGTCHHTEVC
jgi:hypothetical protein